MEKIKEYILEIIIIGILILLTIFCFSLYYLTYKNPMFQSISYLSGISSFVVAILTTIYVYTTLNQFKVMRKQLDEMRKDRELQHQPFLWVNDLEVYAEIPRFFYSPPEDEYKVLCRYFAELSIKNIGSFPSISNDISASISIFINDNKKHFFTSNERINVIEDKELVEKDNFGRLIITSDIENSILNAIVENNKTILTIRFVFRNTLGACFETKVSYALYVKGNEREISKSYLEILSSSSIRYADKIKKMRKIKTTNRLEWNSILDDCVSDVECRVSETIGRFSKSNLDIGINEDDNEILELDESEIADFKLNFQCYMIPQSLKTTVLSEKEYSDIQASLSYGAPVDLVKSTCS